MRTRTEIEIDWIRERIKYLVSVITTIEYGDPVAATAKMFFFIDCLSHNKLKAIEEGKDPYTLKKAVVKPKKRKPNPFIRDTQVGETRIFYPI